MRIGVVEALRGTVPLQGPVLGAGNDCGSIEIANGAAVAGGVAAAASTPAGAAVRGGGTDTGTASPAVALATTVASNPVLCTELSEVNTIVSNEPLRTGAGRPFPDRVASTGELAEPPSYSRKVS